MPKTDSVPVFYRDQDDLREREALTWTREMCRAAKGIRGSFFDHGRKFRLAVARPRIYPVTAADLKTSNHLPAAETITFGEILANVGITSNCESPNTPALRHLVRAAQAKIRAYPRVHDDLAVVACGRWYASERLVVSAIQ